MKNFYWIIILSLCLLSFFFGRHSVEQLVETSRDTVMVMRIDTLIREKVVPKRVVVDRVVYDTLNTIDSILVEVAVPISKYIFADSLYRAEISGYEVTLDKIELFSRLQTIMVTEKLDIRKKRFGLGLQMGYGVGDGGFYPYVGVGLSYNILLF